MYIKESVYAFEAVWEGLPSCSRMYKKARYIATAYLSDSQLWFEPIRLFIN